MGVSLERVQNKFACIIGELCSEPMVLSQFAIWLDLRLAEYKAKGSISLEISGEDPDPIWLKGHKPAAPSTHQGELTADMYDPTGGGGTNYDPDNTDYQDRLSQEIVMIKDDPEVSERVFPVSLHGNARLGSPHLKRKLSDNLSSGSNLHRSSISSSPPPAKLHRPSPSSTHSAPANESLMSIISGRDDGSEIYETPESQSSVQSTQQAMGDNSLSGYAVSDTAESSSPLPSTSNTRVPEMSISDSTDRGLGYVNTDDWNSTLYGAGTSTPMPVPFGYSVQISPAELAHMYPLTYPQHLSNKSIREKMVDVELKSYVNDAVKIVGLLSRWLWSKHGEIRELQDIPPEILDGYLAEFFSKMRKRDGTDFDQRVMNNHRSLLAKHLQEKGYAHSITKSFLFTGSRVAYSYRRKELSSKK